MVLSLDFVALHVTHLVTSASDLGCSVCVGGGGGGVRVLTWVCVLCVRRRKKRKEDRNVRAVFTLL